MAKGKDLQTENHKGFVVGPALGLAREAAGITQEDAAKAVAVHKMTLSEWERGKARVPADALMILLPLYGISFDDLVPGQLSQKPRRSAPGRVAERSATYGGEITFTTTTAAQEARAWLEQYLLELARAGADGEFLAWARRFLFSPQNYAIGELNDAEKLVHMKRLSVSVGEILDGRLGKRRTVSQGRGTPVPRAPKQA